MLPFVVGALEFLAIKFADRVLLRDVLYDLLPEPPPESAQGMVAFPIGLQHGAAPDESCHQLGL